MAQSRASDRAPQEVAVGDRDDKVATRVIHLEMGFSLRCFFLAILKLHLLSGEYCLWLVAVPESAHDPRCALMNNNALTKKQSK